ncbi:hypothetical protein [Vagococcus fluvialis]|uniref:hypothetical protein n=1 Tax=Vagococcus fluvialis TaxID=2738 RepID=UPI0037B5395F
MDEKVILKITPIVKYKDENWHVSKINIEDLTVEIYRTVLFKENKMHRYDIQHKRVNHSELLTTNDKKMVIKED